MAPRARSARARTPAVRRSEARAPAEKAIRAADGMGRRHLAHQLCSALFNLQYWKGIADASGFGPGVWRNLSEKETYLPI